MEAAGADYGFELTEANAAQRSADLKAGYERFQKEQPELWKWMQEGILKYQDTAAKSSSKDQAAPGF